MTQVKVVTDSTADIPQHLVEELGIHVVPLNVHFGNNAYVDGVDMSADEFYAKLKETEELPTTSQPSPADFVDTYKNIHKDQGTLGGILSIHLSSALSGTYQSASLAQNMIEEEIDVRVIDSKKASYATGIVVVAVAEAAKQGKNIEECTQLAEKLLQNSVVYFLVDTLQYLQKGGRIGKASALFGSLLNIKPILSLDEEGEVYPIDKVRGTKKATQKIFDNLRSFADDDAVRVGISHAASEHEAEQVMERLKSEFNVSSHVLTNIGSVIGAHVGPGTIAIIMMKEE